MNPTPAGSRSHLGQRPLLIDQGTTPLPGSEAWEAFADDERKGQP